MSNRTVQNSQLTPNTAFYVRGELGFARITSQIAGEELRKSDERRSARGWIPVGKPYTTATVNKAQVLMKNPQAPTNEETYAQESLYTSQNGNGSYSYTCNNKGKFLPWVGQRNADGSVDQIVPEGELASGLKVTLCMRIFAVRGRMNKGVTLDGIIVEEPIRYYNNNQAGAMLADSGIAFHANPAAEAARRVDGNAPAVAGGNGVDEFDGMDEPFQAQPAMQSPYSAPAQNVVQPQPNIPASQPMAQPMTPQAAPFSNPSNQKGIRYNPDGNNGNVNTGNRNY